MKNMSLFLAALSFAVATASVVAAESCDYSGDWTLEYNLSGPNTMPAKANFTFNANECVVAWGSTGSVTHCTAWNQNLKDYDLTFSFYPDTVYTGHGATIDEETGCFSAFAGNISVANGRAGGTWTLSK